MPPPPPPPEFMQDLVGEILLRVPPGEPAHLVRAALVCKPWRRILFDPAFLRRYREFHRTPPLLGLLYFEKHDLEFVSTTTASPFATPALKWRPLDCRHGRVLFYSSRTRGLGLLLWDPITGDEQRFSMPEDRTPEVFSAAVLCAADSCNHLDCHGGPFRVVFAGTDQDYVTWVTEFSSETGAWSAMAVVDFSASNGTGLDSESFVDVWPSLFTGDAVYFMLELGKAILKYDLGGRGLSVMDTPDVYDKPGIFMTAEDGELGFAGVRNYDIHLWSWKTNAEGTAGWVKLRDIELRTLLSIPDGYIEMSPELVGFAEGTDTIFISRNNRIFTLKLKSGQVRNLGHRLRCGAIVPYVSFYAPDLVGVRQPPP